MYGHTEVVSLLIEKNADVHRTTSRAESALHMACEGGHERTASVLLSHDVDVECVRSLDFYTPLMCAACFGHVSVVNTLIKQSADVNYKRPEPLSDTCLMRAAKFNRVGVVHVLLATTTELTTLTTVEAASTSCCRINECDYEHRTALHQAVQYNAEEAVRTLLRRGADVNLACKLGMTALMYACQAVNEGIVALLVQQPQLNPLLRNNAGKTALELLHDETRADASFSNRIEAAHRLVASVEEAVRGARLPNGHAPAAAPLLLVHAHGPQRDDAVVLPSRSPSAY